MNNYRLLPALKVLLTTRNVSAAAEQMNVTQSSMSKTLSQLREAFDDPLLVREGNQFHLTVRARALQQRLPTLLQELESLYRPDEFIAAHSGRSFSLALSPFFSTGALPSVICQMQNEAPDTSLHCTHWEDKGAEALATSSLDLVAVVCEEVPEGLYGKTIGRDHYLVAMRPNHPLAEKKLSLADYLNAKHIQVEGISDRVRQVDAVLGPLGSRDILARVPSFETALTTLSGCDALITAPAHLLEKNSHKLHTAVSPLELPQHSYMLLWNARHHHDPEHKWFRELVATELTGQFCNPD